MNDKIVVAFDMDGALLNSLPECYNTTLLAWREIYGRDYPYDYAGFAQFRKYVKAGLDFFTIPILCRGREMTDQDVSEFERLREEHKTLPIPQMFKTAYFNQRQLRRESNMDAWIAESPLYAGVEEMFKKLKGMPLVAPIIITGKDKPTVEDVFAHYGIDDIQAIYDESVGERPVQYEAALSDFRIEPGYMVAYDDIGDILRTARTMGIVPIAAPQGFDSPENITEFRQALPEQVPGVLRELF